MKSNYIRVIIPLFFMILLSNASLGFIMPELGPMLLTHSSQSIVSPAMSLEFRHWCYGVILSLPIIFMSIGSPIWGAISDSIGRKSVLLIALVGILLSSLISALGVGLHMVALLMLAQASLGLMDGSGATAQASIADISHGKQKASFLSLIAVAGTLGFIIGPLLGGFFSDTHLLPWFNYQLPFYLAAVLAFFNIIWISLSFKSKYETKSFTKPSIKKSFIEYSIIFKTKNILKLILIFFCMDLGWAIYFQSISLVLVEWFHYSTHIIGLFIACIAINFSVSLAFIIHVLLHFMGRKTIILFSFPLVIMAGIMLILYPNQQIVWLAIIPIGIGMSLIYSTILSLLSDAVDKTFQGKMMGFIFAVGALAFAISAICIGLFSSLGINYLFMIIIFTAVIGLIIMTKTNIETRENS